MVFVHAAMEVTLVHGLVLHANRGQCLHGDGDGNDYDEGTIYPDTSAKLEFGREQRRGHA